MLRRGGLGKGGEEVEAGEEDKSGALTQQAERGESTGQKVCENVCVFVFLKAI